MALINGATSLEEVIKTVKAGFFQVIRVRCTIFDVEPLALKHELNRFLGLSPLYP
jgi:hypothetical protein